MTYKPGPGVASVLVRHDDESVANDGDGKNTRNWPVYYIRRAPTGGAG